VESQSELVCRFRPDGTLLYVNEAYARSRGETASSMLRGSFWDYIPPADQPNVRALLDSLTPQTPEVRIENRFLTDRDERWMLWTNRAIAFDADGRVAEAQSSGVDITDLKRADAALREADRKKNEFLAVLGHELRNPLAPIRTGLDLLNRLAPSGADTTEIRAMMGRQLGHLVRLIDDLLDLSRIERGKFELRKATVDLRDAVAQGVEAARPTVVARGHRMTLECPAGAVHAVADLTRIAQVVANLVDNAAKYTPEHGRIAVRLAHAGGEAAITVEDNGAGIAPNMLASVFEIFTQAGERGNGNSGGLGIGLSIAKGLVEMHGGRIAAASAGIGKGSTFTVLLPLAEATAASEPADRSTEAPPPARRVLVVDDNVDAATSLAALVRLHGSETRLAHDGEAAVAAAREYRPHVVLLDIGMPKMNGYDACRAIRAALPGAEPLVVALTGWGQEADRRKAKDAGFDDHLVKPAGPEQVIRVLRRGR
jgi:two-component system CheB/CheR fusion protein